MPDDVTSLFAGRIVGFDCVTSGWPLPTVKWLMNGKELKDGDNDHTVVVERKIKGNHLNLSLAISDVDIAHAGNYTCQATNKFRTKRRDILVTVSCERSSLVSLHANTQ